MNSPNEIIGNIYGDMEVIEYCGATDNFVKIYKVKCTKCGSYKKIQYARLNRLETCYHNNKSCGIYLPEYDENIGLTIDDYTIIKRTNKKLGEAYYYVAKCNICGTTFETLIHNFKRHYGTNHNKCSIHLDHSNKYYKRFRKIYDCMRQRTTNSNYNEYHYYGGRGINSDYYKDFMIFYKELFDSYIEHCKKYGEKNTTLDRIDSNKNYDCDNCRWVTLKEQARNKRNSKMVTINGITKPFADLCDELGLKYATVVRRIKAGWDMCDAFDLDKSNNIITMEEK